MTVSTAPVQTLLASVQGWPHWLDPSPRAKSGTVRKAVATHLSRLADAAGLPWDPTGIETVVLPPREAARLAGAHSGWRWALGRAAALALDAAARTGRRHTVTAAALDTAGLVRRQVWAVAAARWVGCWVVLPTRGRNLALHPALGTEPGGTMPALTAARHAAYHHVLHALWLAAIDGQGHGSPAGPLVEMWRWGYWPLGPDTCGRFLVARVVAMPQPV